MKAAIHVWIGECPKVFILMTTGNEKDGKRKDSSYVEQTTATTKYTQHHCSPELLPNFIFLWDKTVIIVNLSAALSGVSLINGMEYGMEQWDGWTMEWMIKIGKFRFIGELALPYRPGISYLLGYKSA